MGGIAHTTARAAAPAQAYPFLAQVCRHWKAVLESREALPALWQELTVDFSHELITGVHVPVRWSDVRPSDEEFREVRLLPPAPMPPAQRLLLPYVRVRRPMSACACAAGWCALRHRSCVVHRACQPHST